MSLTNVAMGGGRPGVARTLVALGAGGAPACAPGLRRQPVARLLQLAVFALPIAHVAHDAFWAAFKISSVKIMVLLLTLWIITVLIL